MCNDRDLEVHTELVSDTRIRLAALGTRKLPDFLYEIPTVYTRCRSLS